MKATLIADLHGTHISEQEKSWLQSPLVGGVILFTRNFENKAQIANLISEVKSLNPRLVISVDHEGGRVQRFREGFTRVPSMGAIGSLYDQDKNQAIECAKAAGYVLAWELKQIGVDITYAPVLDLNFERNEVIGDRSFGVDPQRVIELAEAAISGLKQAGMISVGKHFPGHGWVAGDSHLELPVDDRGIDELELNDLLPFQKLSPVLDWIMPAHVLYSRADDNPAGFSNFWLQTILRNKLGFSGEIVSDDLTMEGAAGQGNYCDRAQAALDAGCSILLTCNNRAAPEQILNWLEQKRVEPISLQKYQAKMDSGDEQCYRASLEKLKLAKLI